MSDKMTRRTFIKKSATIGVSSVLGQQLVPEYAFAGMPPDMAIARGPDYFRSAVKAVEVLGGMGKFVPKNAKVAILANAQSNNPGTFTKPEILRAAIRMCKEAGACSIGCIGWLSLRNWKTTGLKKVIDDEGADLVITSSGDESQFNSAPVPRGVKLNEARILKSFYEYDILLNMNITKEHSGYNLSGALKNLMGMNSPVSNQMFHKKDWTMLRDDITHLDQCIADLNTVIRANLCIIDATEFITTNGPDGPGNLIKPMKVIAGTDPVAIDAYCATLFGRNPRDLVFLNRAFEHGLGEMDLKKVHILEFDT